MNVNIFMFLVYKLKISVMFLKVKVMGKFSNSVNRVMKNIIILIICFFYLVWFVCIRCGLNILLSEWMIKLMLFIVMKVKESGIIVLII